MSSQPHTSQLPRAFLRTQVSGRQPFTLTCSVSIPTGAGGCVALDSVIDNLLHNVTSNPAALFTQSYTAIYGAVSLMGRVTDLDMAPPSQNASTLLDTGAGNGSAAPAPWSGTKQQQERLMAVLIGVLVLVALLLVAQVVAVVVVLRSGANVTAAFGGNM